MTKIQKFLDFQELTESLIGSRRYDKRQVLVVTHVCRDKTVRTPEQDGDNRRQTEVDKDYIT